MELCQHTFALQFLSPHVGKKRSINFSDASLIWRKNLCSTVHPSLIFPQPKLTWPRLVVVGSRGNRINVWKVEELLRLGEGDEDDDEEESSKSEKDGNKDSFVMDVEERKEWRLKIREVIDRTPDVEEETDLIEKRKKMQKLLAEYPLVVEEEDPDWPEDADGWGFNLGQFFNKISIKNVKKDDDDDDDENYDSENEIVWRDDDYIRPIYNDG